MGKIIGIDDAGRGPVLGPMILAGVIAEESDLGALKEWGVKDSKMLTRRAREIIREAVKQTYKFHVEVVDPKEIDSSANLNTLEAIRTAMVINNLVEGETEEVRAIVDCPSTNIRAWTKEVMGMIKNKDMVSLACEHKADRNHMIVAAASIMAKEKREEILDGLRDQLGVDFGSGYPADPVTKDFLKENYTKVEYKDLIRHSWATVKKLVKGKSQTTLNFGSIDKKVHNKKKKIGSHVKRKKKGKKRKN